MSDIDADDSSMEEVISMREIPPIPVPRPKHAFLRHVRSGYEDNELENRLQQSTAKLICTSDSPQCEVMNYHDQGDLNTRDNQVVLGKFPPIISLNVGGSIYMTRLSTLLKYSDSMLAAMFSGRHHVDRDRDGHYFLDTNGAVFGHILEFLRYNSLPPNDVSFVVHRDAEYYGLQPLVERLQLRPELASLTVKEAHRAQFPGYHEAKTEVIHAAIANASINRVGEVVIYVFRAEFKAKVQNFNPQHGCIVESAHVTVGPWDSTADEEAFMKCLEMDLLEEGFNVKPHESKRKCKYYYGQTCQKFVYKLQIIFD